MESLLFLTTNFLSIEFAVLQTSFVSFVLKIDLFRNVLAVRSQKSGASTELSAKPKAGPTSHEKSFDPVKLCQYYLVLQQFIAGKN